MQLKNYQLTAVCDLLDDTMKLLRQNGSKRLIFKSSTGSGKTLVVAEYLKQLVDRQDLQNSLAFIWTAPHKLHQQSKGKLENYFEKNHVLECSVFEDLDDGQIKENEILFFNWESINKKENVYIRENEKEKNLSSVIERTKDAGREIVLIIDESHVHTTSEISQKLISDIAPKLTIEVSATPVIQNPDKIVPVQIEEVKIEGMIKKSIILNSEFMNILSGKCIKSKLANGADHLVLKTAIQKRKELLKAYKNEGLDINPLILIQLPDNMSKQDDNFKNKIIRLLKKVNITTDNEKLAIYLSNEKINLENLAKNNHKSEVLIFKQAIALGWDCPRAQILVLFRNSKSLTFSIQTVGRIMRMPEPERGHYKEEILNHSYVYTNLSDISIREDMGKDYVSIFTSHRYDKYKSVHLHSVHRKRHREISRLSPLFVSLYLSEAKKYGLKKKISSSQKKMTQNFISDYEADSADELVGKKIVAKNQVEIVSESDLQESFDKFIFENLSPFYPEERSIGRVKEAIYKFFHNQLGMEYTDQFSNILRTVLNKNNIEHFKSVLDITKDRYCNKVKNRASEFEEINNWEIPEKLNIGGNLSKYPAKLSVMQPFYYDYQWKPEKKFIEFLERSENVVWWFKNGVQDATFFAVPYTENKEKKLFYLDFIVQLKDGRIGLFDTKSGRTIKDSGKKSDGLQEYIRNHGKTKNIFGGIVTNTDNQNFNGRWIIFDKSSRSLKSDSYTNWKNLELRYSR